MTVINQGISSSTARLVLATVGAVEGIGQPRAIPQTNEPEALTARLLHEAESGLASAGTKDMESV